MKSTRLRISRAAFPLLVSGGLIVSSPASDDTKKAKDTDHTAQARETVAKPLTEKEKKKKEAKLRKELETPYKKWLTEDVGYIITDEERQAFKHLNTDEEREQFIEQFWLRRDPTPDTVENEFKEEHYRRIAYSNEHYASGIPGWKADRGRIYITFGPPDEIESHPSGGSYQRPSEEGGGETSTYPFEQWRYRYLEGIGNNIIIEFVDTTMSGEYRMTMDPSEKDALLYVPGAGLTLTEQMGLSTKTARFNRTDGTHLGAAFGGTPESMNEFTRLEQFAKLQKPPAVKFKDLEAAINTRITYNVLPMKARIDFIRVTNSTILTNITLQFENKDLQFQAKDGIQKAVVNIFGRLSTLSRRPVNTFERTVTVDTPQQFLREAAARSSIFQESIPLAPGNYRLNVIAKDLTAGNMVNYEVAIAVPHFDDEKLSSSSLILADQLETLPPKSIGLGQFVIGASKVRPRLNETFKRDEKMGLYLQVYNFTPDEKTRRPNASVDYEVLKKGTNEKVFEFSEEVAGMKGASSNQVTIEQLLPLKSLAPGQYLLKLKVTDKNSKQILTPSTTFTVI